MAALARLMGPQTEEGSLLCSRLSANRARHELAELKPGWRRRRYAALEAATTLRLCGLTFELTPTAEAGTVSLDCDDANLATGQAYSACRSGSAVERGVRPHRAPPLLQTCIAGSQLPPESRQRSCAMKVVIRG